MFLQHLPLLSSCRDFKTKNFRNSWVGDVECWKKCQQDLSGAETFKEKLYILIGNIHMVVILGNSSVVEQLYRQKLRLFQWLWCFTEPLPCWLCKINVIWCLWILGKQRLRGEKCLMAVVSQTPALNLAKKSLVLHVRVPICSGISDIWAVIK